MKIYLIGELIQSLKILISTTPRELSLESFWMNMFAGFKVSFFVPGVAILGGLGEWIIANGIYINLVIGAIFIDWILGTLKHWLWIRNFHWKKNIQGLLVKLTLVLAVGFVVEGLSHFSYEYKEITRPILQVFRLTVFMYPAGSIIRSARVISNYNFPPQKIYDTIEEWSEAITKKKKDNV